MATKKNLNPELQGPTKYEGSVPAICHPFKLAQ
jgi:hypothetical protein